MISRRELLKGFTATASGSLLVTHPAPVAAEPPPETTRIRLSQIAGICVAPQYVAQELLKLEGFTDVHYVTIKETNPYPAFISSDIDISMAFVAPFLVQLDAGLRSCCWPACTSAASSCSAPSASARSATSKA